MTTAHLFFFFFGGQTSTAVAPTPIVPASFVPLIDFELDDATYTWAMDGTTILTPTQVTFYESRVKSIGPIHREIPRLCGLMSIGSVEVVYSNEDQQMSALKALQAWRGRQKTIKYGDPNRGISSFAPAYTGDVSDSIFKEVRVDENTFASEAHVTIVDNSLDRLSLPVTKFLKQIVASGYPDAAPAYMKPVLIPWVMGRFGPSSGGDNGGQLPAYCINPVTFQYVAAHEPVTVAYVYVYGVLKEVTTDYTLDTFTASGGEVFTRITFASDPRDPNRSVDEIEVTWAGTGINNAPGVPEDRPIYILQYFMVSRCGFTYDELDTADSWFVTSLEFAERNFKGSLVVTQSDLTIGDVIARFLRTNGLRLFRKRSGLWAIDFIGSSKSPVLALTENDIVAGSFSQRNYSSDSFASTLQLSFDANYANGNEFFATNENLISEEEIANLGSDIRYPLNLWFGRTLDGDASTPIAIGALYLALMRESGNLVQFEIPIEYFNSIDLGDIVTLTHWEGIAPDSTVVSPTLGTLGFVAKRIVVTAIDLIPSPATSQLVISGYVEPVLPSDSPDLSASFTIELGLTVEDMVAS